jgi:endonuclease YncB( thermonuclease family)
VAGISSRDFLRDLILGKEIFIESEKQDLYNRYIARIYIYMGDVYTCINDLLVKEGHAIYQEYR